MLTKNCLMMVATLVAAVWLTGCDMYNPESNNQTSTPPKPPAASPTPTPGPVPVPVPVPPTPGSGGPGGGPTPGPKPPVVLPTGAPVGAPKGDLKEGALRYEASEGGSVMILAATSYKDKAELLIRRQPKGAATAHWNLMRIGLDGTVDATFGKGGIISIAPDAQDFQPSALAVGADGMSYIAGISHASRNPEIIQFKENGEQGFRTVLNVKSAAIALNFKTFLVERDKLLTFGATLASSSGVAIIRVDATDGKIVTNFGEAGTAIVKREKIGTNNSPVTLTMYDMAVDDQKQVVATGLATFKELVKNGSSEVLHDRTGTFAFRLSGSDGVRDSKFFIRFVGDANFASDADSSDGVNIYNDSPTPMSVVATSVVALDKGYLFGSVRSGFDKKTVLSTEKFDEEGKGDASYVSPYQPNHKGRTFSFLEKDGMVMPYITLVAFKDKSALLVGPQKNPATNVYYPYTEKLGANGAGEEKDTGGAFVAVKNTLDKAVTSGPFGIFPVLVNKGGDEKVLLFTAEKVDAFTMTRIRPDGKIDK